MSMTNVYVEVVNCYPNRVGFPRWMNLVFLTLNAVYDIYSIMASTLLHMTGFVKRCVTGSSIADLSSPRRRVSSDTPATSHQTLHFFP